MPQSLALSGMGLEDVCLTVQSVNGPRIRVLVLLLLLLINTITTITTGIFMTLITSMIATDKGSHHADSEL